MNKTELIDAIATKSGQSKVTIAAVLDGFIETVKESLSENESVQLVGFGSFDVSERAAREGRNPSTGLPLKIAAKKVVKFKVGKTLSEAVAGPKAVKTATKSAKAAPKSAKKK